MSLTNRTATQLLDDLRSRQTTAVDVTRAFLDRIDKHDKVVGAFLSVSADSALAAG